MSGQITTRQFEVTDYDPAIRLWSQAEGIEIAEGDSRDDIARYVRQNPGLSRVAEDGDVMIGVALCGHDGRRGFIYHLAVEPAYQQRGIARRLVTECVEGLRRLNLKRALILVAADNPVAQTFWQRCGWEDVSGAKVMGIDL
jgi:ribosomal protein S18 acetylase RimI-like enzyme